MSAVSSKPRTFYDNIRKEDRKELFSIIDGRLTLNLHPGQKRAMESPAKYIFMFAGSQGGKTSLGAWWLYQEICRRCIYPEYLEEVNQSGGFDTVPAEGWVEEGGDFFAISATYDLFDLKMLPEIQKVFENVLRVGKYHAGKRIVELRNPHTGRFVGAGAKDTELWGRVILRSAHAGKTSKQSENIGVTSLESATAKAAWLDECGLDTYTVETWDSIKARLRLNSGRVFGTTTLYNYGWLKTEIYDKWLAGNPLYDVIQFDSSLNPSFPMSEYLEAKESMPEWKFNMRYRGQYSRPAGMIFGDFDETTGIIDPFVLPRETMVVVGIDPGGVNTALVWMGVYQGNVIVFRETLEGNLTTVGHVARTQEVAHFFTGRVKYVGGAKSEEQFRRDWGSAGITVYEPPIHDVQAGIDRIIELMKRGKFKVFSTCRGLLQEIREYRRVIDMLGEPTEEIKDKRMFHRVDALRYGCSVMRLVDGGTFTNPKVDKSRLPHTGVKLPFGNKKIPGLR